MDINIHNQDTYNQRLITQEFNEYQLITPELNESQSITQEFNETQSITQEFNETSRLTQEFNKKFFNNTRKSIEITFFSILKDDIKNYRPLTELQLLQIETLSDSEKLEIIKNYNTMFMLLENIL